MHTKKNSFSIIIPLYNKEESITKTIQSVLNQTVINFEIIIINDGSTDNSLKMVQDMRDSRIRIIDKENEGVSVARNVGVCASINDWICFLDADDYWDSNHLSAFSEVISSERDINFLTTGFRIANSDLNTSKVINWHKRGLFNYFEVAATNGFAVHTSSVCIRRSILVQNQFDRTLSLGEDNELFSRIGKKYSVYFLPQASTYYISDSQNKETRKDHPIEKDFLYRIDFNIISSDAERKYYMLYIISHLLKFSIKQKDYLKTKKLYNFYRQQIKFRDVLYYISKKLSFITGRS